MNPNGLTLAQLIQLLQQSGGGVAPSGAASVPKATAGATGLPGVGTLGGGASLLSPSGTGTSTGIQAGNLVDPLFGINAGAASGEGGAIGGGLGSIIGLLFGPLGSALGGLGGSFLGDILGGWIGGGVPAAAKSESIANAFGSSGNSLDALIGQYIGRGINNGGVLSESGGSTLEGGARRFAAMLEALTGQSAPGVTGTGFNNNPYFGTPSLGTAGNRFQLPAGYEFASDPSKLGDIFQDLKNAIGLSAPGVGGKTAGAQGEWQDVVRQLIQQGGLTKYQGPLGAAGGGNTSSSSIPNVSLPHPLAQNSAAFTPAPYPV